MVAFLSVFFLLQHKIKPKIQALDGMEYVQGSGNMESYYVDKTPVTVAQFRKFINATHYKTESEKFGDSGVFDFKTGEWSLVKRVNWE